MKHIPTLVLAAGLLTAAATIHGQTQTIESAGVALRPQQDGVATDRLRQDAQAPPRGAKPPMPPPAPPPPAATPFREGRDSSDTREQLRDVLSQYPPSVREVLRIDSSLLSRPDYLATYPALAGFLEQHPEVAHNPGYFVGETRVEEETRTNPSVERFRALRGMGEDIMTVLIILTITTGLAFVIKSLLEQRRWQRTLRAQADLHTKLIDRFASTNELLAYLQSPAGKTFAETPMPPANTTRGMDAPLGRIFWSLQAGTVLIAAGAGFLLVGGRMGEIGPPFFALGTLLATIGVGFVASAGVAFMLSRRLGLVQPLEPRAGTEAPGS